MCKQLDHKLLNNNDIVMCFWVFLQMSSIKSDFSVNIQILMWM